MRAEDPYVLFRKWFADAVKAGTKLPEAMALATASRKGAPSVRIVLNRGLDRRGFAFFTNYHSRKAADLLRTRARRWCSIGRSSSGRCAPKDACRNSRAPNPIATFNSRPRESRLSAWISPQSEEIPDRAFLEEAYARAEARFAGKRIPRPPFWGGFRLVPDGIEFWQGQPYRLHDRLSYRKTARGWKVVTLAP